MTEYSLFSKNEHDHVFPFYMPPHHSWWSKTDPLIISPIFKVFSPSVSRESVPLYRNFVGYWIIFDVVATPPLSMIGKQGKGDATPLKVFKLHPMHFKPEAFLICVYSLSSKQIGNPVESAKCRAGTLFCFGCVLNTVVKFLCVMTVQG